MDSLRLEQVADRAGVDERYVLHLVDEGAIARRQEGYEERDVHLVALLHMWEGAGLSARSILDAVEAGKLSLDFLETPAWTLPEHLGLTYKQFAVERRVPLHLLMSVHEAIGFAPPDPDDRAERDDAVIADLVHAALGAGASEEGVRRLFRLYADNLRRLATAEAELYLADVEGRWRESGMSESEMLQRGSETGRGMRGPVEAALLAIYNRHRQHVWSERSIDRAEEILDRAGLYRRPSRTPAICFVDLAGYTRLTEEQGDEAAARLASNLATLVDDIARRHGGRPIRWLGDGGMFYFKEPAAAVFAALEMVEDAPAAGLPPTHIGIQAGPVIFQEGDVYGRTVNIAARIAALAKAGEILTSEETMERVERSGFRFEPIGPLDLKGVARPVMLYRVSRRTR